jgi:hypothetical protein
MNDWHSLHGLAWVLPVGIQSIPSKLLAFIYSHFLAAVECQCPKERI